MVSRLKNRPLDEEVNGFRIREESPKSSSMSIEMEMLSIAVSKAARNVFEELGTSCAGSQENSDAEVFGGANPHETIDDVNEVLDIGDSLSRVSWGSNAMNNRAYYIVDSGHGPVTVKPKEDSEGGEASAKRVQQFLDDWIKESYWYQRQAEVCNRLDRHGEVFDILQYQDDGILQLQFAEPVDLDDDADSEYQFSEDSDLAYQDFLGVRRTNDLMFKPVAYFIDGAWYDDLRYKTKKNMLADFADDTDVLIQHRKRNVLSRDNRGLSLYWPVREELTWAKRLLANLMRVSTFQAAYGMIRTVSEIHSADAVKSYLGSLQTGTANANNAEKFDFPAPAVVTKPASVTYEFPETGAGTSNHIEMLVNLLRACASGMRLPEFMLTANVGEGNFASTLVSEGPFHKGMRFEQGQMINEDLRILYQALRWAAEKSVDGISHEDIDRITLEVKAPRVQTRNRKEDFEVNQAMWEKRVISRKTFAASEDKDDEAEQAQIATEIPAEHPAPLSIQKIPTPTGPEPGLKSDQLAEKGVMSGEPPEDPLKQ
jgi:hypothetical protein